MIAVGSPTPSPSTTSTVVVPPFGPTQGVTGADTASAGLYAFLIVVGLIAVSVVIFIAMNRSLKTARANLGGSVLPRREADRIPVAPYDGRRSAPRTTMPAPAATVPAPPDSPEPSQLPSLDDAGPVALNDRQPEPAPEIPAAPAPQTSREPVPSAPTEAGGSEPSPSPPAPAAAAEPAGATDEAGPAARAPAQAAPDGAAPSQAAPDAEVAPPGGVPSASADPVASPDPVPDEPSWWTPRPPDPHSPKPPA